MSFSPLARGIVGGEHAPARPVNLKTANMDALVVSVSKDGRSQSVSVRGLIDEIKDAVFTDLLLDPPELARRPWGGDHG